MVSEGIINSDLSEIETIFSKYETNINDFKNDRVWQGASRDNASSKCEEFISSYKGPISNQMNDLANAVSLFKRYKLAKEYKDTLMNNYNRAIAEENAELAAKYKSEISYTEGEIKSLKSQIESKLNSIMAVNLTTSSTGATGSISVDDGTTTSTSSSTNEERAEILNKANGVESSTEEKVALTGSSGERIVAKAEEIHQYMEDNKYTYCVYGGNSYEECDDFGKDHGLNTTFEESKTGYHNTCCATYVSWVLQETGYLSKSEHTNGADTLASTLRNKGWTKVSANELEPGDVMVFSGHVQIYGDNAEIYNAGSGRSIRGDVTQNSGMKNCKYGLRAPE